MKRALTIRQRRRFMTMRANRLYDDGFSVDEIAIMARSKIGRGTRIYRRRMQRAKIRLQLANANPTWDTERLRQEVVIEAINRKIAITKYSELSR